jgi:hypothetical protein
MLANGLYSSRFGQRAVVNGIVYPIPTYSAAAAIWGDNYQSLLINGHDDELASMPQGDFSLLTRDSLVAAPTPNSAVLVALALVAAALLFG